MARSDSRQKQRILEAAIRVFAEHGLAAASIRLVARQAGLNSALIYYYFENKQALFAAAVASVLQGFFDSLQRRPQPFRTGRERIAFLVNSIFAYAAERPPYLRLVGLAFHLHPPLFAKAVSALLARQFPYPLKILQDGVDQKQLRPVHPLQSWWHIVGACLFALKLRDVLAHIECGSAPNGAKIRLPTPNPSQEGSKSKTWKTNEFPSLEGPGLPAEASREEAKAGVGSGFGMNSSLFGSAPLSFPDPATQPQVIIETLVRGMVLTSGQKKEVVMRKM